MKWRAIQPLELVHFLEEPRLSIEDWLAATRELLANGARPVAMFCQEEPGGSRRVWTVLVSPSDGHCLTNTVFSPGEKFSYPAFSADFPSMSHFECELYEQSGIEPASHPGLRPVRSADDWRKNGAPYAFYRVEGEEVHEVAVGPVHAGVIEPGHFRFQCHGEEVLHLEIQLGYQHRGVEKLLPHQTPTQQIALIESTAGDSVIAHITTFCSALEALAGVTPSLRELTVRGIAAELERVAMHLATLGGIATDIGFALPAAAFGALRTAVINLSAEICGSRFGRGWIIPGGVRFDLDDVLIEKATRILHEVFAKFPDVEALLFDSPSALTRLEETGVVTTAQARAAGLVGLPARASGVDCDTRADFPYGIYRYSSIPSLRLDSGDVYARAKLRALEIRDSLQFIFEQLENLPAHKPRNSPGVMARNAFTLALTESHRGEVAHVLVTDENGQLSQIKIKDPSFHNWHGLALAMRDGGISDFPLCNKSFDLSYAGHDL